jgi:hypothetical protein
VTHKPGFGPRIFLSNLTQLNRAGVLQIWYLIRYINYVLYKYIIYLNVLCPNYPTVLIFSSVLVLQHLPVAQVTRADSICSAFYKNINLVNFDNYYQVFIHYYSDPSIL